MTLSSLSLPLSLERRLNFNYRIFMIQFPAFDELSRIYRILYDTHYECGMRVTASMMLITSQQITNPVYVYLAFIQFHTNLAPLDATSSLS